MIKLTGPKDVNVKIKYSDVHPFEKLQVRLKKKIVAMNVDELNVDLFKGEYVEPKEWDEFITKEDVIVIDTRNHYEVEVGTFKSAINSNTKTFKQFLALVQQNQ